MRMLPKLTMSMCVRAGVCDDGKQRMENIVDKFTIKTLFFIVIIRASHVTSVDLGNHGHTA